MSITYTEVHLMKRFIKAASSMTLTHTNWMQFDKKYCDYKVLLSLRLSIKIYDVQLNYCTK